MRILWVSNSGWSHQGYGVQVRGLLPHLVEQGHEIAIFAFYGLEGGKVDLPLGGQDGPVLTHYPRHVERYGNDVVAAHARDWDADCVITLMDAWVCNPEVYRPLNWLAWTPIDQEPIPDLVLARLPHMKRVLPYSKFGERLVQQTGLPCSYIPHGVDTDIYRPFPPGGRAQAKEVLGFEASDFVVGMVGANKGWPPRKGFPEAFQAFKMLRERVPQARLFVHSLVTTDYGGPHLMVLAETLGIGPYVKFSDQYLQTIGMPAQGMAVMYNAFDVLLQASTHEGFGLPIIEAQACGTPVVAVDATSMTELVAPGYGTLVAPLQKQLTTMMSWVAVQDITALAHALHAVHDHPPTDVDQELIVSWARQYDWKIVAEHYWKPMLEQVADDLRVSTRGLARAMEQAIVTHRHDPSDLDAEPCCPECCDCDRCCEDDECSRHTCCCQCVVEEIMAITADAQVTLDFANDKYAHCPHSGPTALDGYLDELRERVKLLDQVEA